MFARERKLIALLLSAAMVFTMNTGVIAADDAEDDAPAATASWEAFEDDYDVYAINDDEDAFVVGDKFGYIETTTETEYKKINDASASISFNGYTSSNGITIEADKNITTKVQVFLWDENDEESLKDSKTISPNVLLNVEKGAEGTEVTVSVNDLIKDMIKPVVDKDIDVEIKASAVKGYTDYTFIYGNEETEEEKKAKQLAQDVSENKATNATSIPLTAVTGVTVSYNSWIPYFGKNLKDISNLNLSISYNGQTYKVTKAKVVRDKEGDASVSNASIVIKKVDGIDKKVLKDIKKATKASKKKKGAIRLRIYAYTLNDKTVADLAEFTAKGKSGKYSLSFKLSGKKNSIKQKKDSFGNKNKGTWTVSQGGISVSTNDIQGSTTKFTNKTK